MEYETRIEYTGAKEFLEMLIKAEAVARRIEDTFERISRKASGIQFPSGGGGAGGGGGRRGSGGGGGGTGDNARHDGSINVHIGSFGNTDISATGGGAGVGGFGGGGGGGPVNALAGGSPFLPSPVGSVGGYQGGVRMGGGGWYNPPPALPGGGAAGGGPGGIPWGAIIGRLLLFAAAVELGALAMRRLNEFNNERSAYIREQAAGGYYGGGSATTTAQQAAVGGFMGMSSTQMGQFAETLGSRLQGGGFGSALARANGITDVGMYTIDKSQNLMKMIDLLTHIKSNTEAIVVARSLGMEPFLALRDTDQNFVNQLKNSMQPLTDRDKRMANDYNAAKQSMDNAIDAKKNWVATWITEPIGTVIAGQISRALQPGANGAGQWVANATTFGTYGVVRDIAAMIFGNGSDKDKAVKENTEALHQHTRALKDGTDWSGGSPLGHRRFGAVPRGWKFNEFEAALQGQAQMLGAFSI